MAKGRKTMKRSLLIDNLLSFSLPIQLALVFIVFLLVLFVGWSGITWLYGNAELVKGDKTTTPFWLTLLTMLNPSQLSVNAGADEILLFALLVLLAIFGFALLQGLFISSFVGVRDERTRLAREGRQRYRLPGGQKVILGWDETGPGIVRYLRQKDSNGMIIILSSIESDEVRLSLAKANIGDLCNIVIYYGNRADISELENLEIEKASQIYIIGEKGLSSPDSRTLQTIVNLLEKTDDIEETRKPIPCFLQINELYTYFLLQKVDFYGKATVKKLLDIRLCNFYEGWAKKLWSSFPNDDRESYPCLARDPQKRVHLVIAGFGRMGQALALEAARICHYANPEKTKTKITVIDKNITELKEQFVSRNFVEKNGTITFHDIDFDFMKCHIESEDARKILKQAVNEDNLTVAICFSDMDASLAAALSLPLEVSTSTKATILVRQYGYSGIEHSGLEALKNRLSKNNNSEGKNKEPNNEGLNLVRNYLFFGGLDEFLYCDNTDEKLAKMLNAVYKIFIEKEQCIESLEKHLGARSGHLIGLDELFWGNQNVKFRWSSIYQARAFPEKIRSLGYKISPKKESPEGNTFFPIKSDLEASKQIMEARNTLEKALKTVEEDPNNVWQGDIKRFSEAEHDRWWAERILAGWDYAKKTNKEMLEHSDMKRFEELLPSTQIKDGRSILLAPWLLHEFAGIEFEKTKDD